MRKFNQITKYLVFIFIALIMTACSGGNCATDTTSPFSSYTFRNGSVLTGQGLINATQGSNSSLTFKLNGGTDLPFAIQLSTVPSSSPRVQDNKLQSVSGSNLSGEFNPDILEVTINVSESSSNLDVAIPQNLSPGTYYLHLYANPIAGTKFPPNTYLGYIKVVVGVVSVTQIESALPPNGATGVVTGVNVVIQFNTAMNTSTVNGTNILLKESGTENYIPLINPTYSSNDTTVTFSESNPLSNSTTYSVVIPNPSKVVSQAGAPLTMDSSTYPNGVVTSFTTGSGGTGCSNIPLVVLNQGNNSITTCTINPDGSLKNCSGVNTPITGLNSPVAAVANMQYPYSSFYIANSGDNTLGTYSPSSTTYTPLTPPSYVSSPTGFGTYNGYVNYVVNSNGTLTQCSDGGNPFHPLGSCSPAFTPSGFPNDAYGIGASPIASSVLPNPTYFITRKNSNSMSVCTDSGQSGMSGGCTSAGGSNFNSPVAVATYSVNPSGLYVYVANAGNNTITKCNSNSSGQLSNCSLTGSGFNNPSSVFVYSEDMQGGLDNLDGILIVANKGNNSVTICNISNINGSLSSCQQMPYGFNQPVGLDAYNSCG